MSTASTEYLGLIVFPDITGVYQRDIRLALVAGSGSNMHKIDAGVKAIAQTLTALRNSLATVATSGSYTDLSNKPDIAAAVPLATTSVAGKVKPDGVTILIDENGVIRAAVPISIATTEKAGIVKPDGDRQYEKFKELHFRQYADIAEAKLRQQTDIIYAQTEAQKVVIDSQAQATQYPYGYIYNIYRAWSGYFNSQRFGANADKLRRYFKWLLIL